MATLAEHNPDLARRLGVDPATLAADSEYLGKLCIVTLQEPHYATGARRDPIGLLPPAYQRYGIIDRDYKDRVQVGETWIVRPYSNHTGAIFLLPLTQVDLAGILALDHRFTRELAAELVDRRPELLSALRDLLPSQAPTKADPKELQTLRAQLAHAKQVLQDAYHLGELQAELPARIAASQEALMAAIHGIPDAQQAVETKQEVLVRKEKPAADLPIYMADANLFINAERWRWPQCNRLLDAAGMRFRLAVSRQVHTELKHSYRLPQDLLVIDVPTIAPELRELAAANASALGKKAGDADLSLIQALLDRSDVRGIITEDPDIRNMHPASIVQKLRNRAVECLTAAEFCDSHRKLVA